MCTDGSRLENGGVGAAWVWQQDGEWRGEGTLLGSNKEVFDAEVYAIQRAVGLLNDRAEADQSHTVFSDLQAAIFRVQHEDCGPAQALARAVVEASYELRARGNESFETSPQFYNKKRHRPPQLSQESWIPPTSLGSVEACWSSGTCGPGRGRARAGLGWQPPGPSAVPGVVAAPPASKAAPEPARGSPPAAS